MSATPTTSTPTTSGDLPVGVQGRDGPFVAIVWADNEHEDLQMKVLRLSDPQYEVVDLFEGFFVVKLCTSPLVVTAFFATQLAIHEESR